MAVESVGTGIAPGNPVSRRAALGVAGASMAMAAVPVLAGADPDAAIHSAWVQRQDAFSRFNALPFADESAGAIYTPAERECWAIIDAAEETIRASVARTPDAVVVQLWTALHHTIVARVDEEAMFRGDFAHFEARDDHLDWSARLALAALRSLQAMGGKSGVRV